jgi:hypothetical protein
MQAGNEKGPSWVWLIIMIVLAIVLGILVCLATLYLWDYLEDIGIIPRGF